MPTMIRLTAHIRADIGPRLDALAVVLQAAVPGSRMERPDALRAAIFAGVEALEKKYEIKVDSPDANPAATSSTKQKGGKRRPGKG